MAFDLDWDDLKRWISTLWLFFLLAILGYYLFYYYVYYYCCLKWLRPDNELLTHNNEHAIVQYHRTRRNTCHTPENSEHTIVQDNKTRRNTCHIPEHSQHVIVQHLQTRRNTCHILEHSQPRVSFEDEYESVWNNSLLVLSYWLWTSSWSTTCKFWLYFKFGCKWDKKASETINMTYHYVWDNFMTWIACLWLIFLSGIVGFYLFYYYVCFYCCSQCIDTNNNRLISPAYIV